MVLGDSELEILDVDDNAKMCFKDIYHDDHWLM